ncbi:MAG: type II toxin-antitoxin system mRNA interferase toxin, RelE/StbE family [Rhodospirillales bacterium]|nr:type II toxin-antitoxin system mRNA interferase toxin, RelE/StbE family [Rhodospirillales bacterium]
MFRIEYSRDALKALLRMPSNMARLIRTKVEQLAADPFAPNNNVKRLKGMDAFRLRVGDWRVVYEIDRRMIVILVIRIGSRSSVYED